MPMVYWFSTEAPTLLVGICLPALLPLGRYIMSQYLSPMAHKVRSALRSGGSDLDSSVDNTPLQEHRSTDFWKQEKRQDPVQLYTTDRPSAESCSDELMRSSTGPAQGNRS